MSDDIMNEVAADIRQERFETLWKEYGKKVLGVFIAIVIIVSGYTYFQQRNIDYAKKIGEQYTKALQEVTTGQTQDAFKLFTEVTQSDHPAYRVMARLQLAGIASKPGAYFDIEEAVKQYQAIVDDKKADPSFRNLAKIQMIYTQLQRYQTIRQDTKQLNDYINTLKPLAEKNMPFHYIAMELIGVLHVELQEYDKAADVFVQLAQDKELPRDMLARIELMTQSLATKIRA